ncbi:MAG TPA: SUMF1/EgtB/PvdO family nonheme iron enzyme [Planctomycetota bacterium]|nr:SUMF1/EgtB/PvdO family nonheme iron enzyme [Planctomycetota bacterium]
MGTDEPAGPSLELLVEECLASIDREGVVALERFCAQHSAKADALRRRIAPLLDAGLVGPGGLHDMPERLGEFRILQRLGSGGMGVVYRAVQESLGREVALKLIHPEHLYFPTARERFRREAEMVARLQHGGIAPIYSVGQHAGIPYYAMELIDGLTLADVIQAMRSRDPATLRGEDVAALLRGASPLPDPELAPAWSGPWPRVALVIVRQVALALEHAHRRAVFHRDVKPSNIMLTANGRVLLMDFGLAAESSDAHDTRLTRTGARLGTLAYMPPERLRDSAHGKDARGDVYGLGVVLYELLTLQRPFLGQDSEATRLRILQGSPVRPRAINCEVPWEAETVCLKAMDIEPVRRYPSAAELADDVARALERRPITARRPGPWLRSRRWIGRHPVVTMAFLLAVLLLAAAVTVVIEQQARQQELIERADASQVASLLARAAELETGVQENVPAMQAWLTDARALQARRGKHASALQSLRGQAAPYDAEHEHSATADLAAELDQARRRLGEVASSPEDALNDSQKLESLRLALATRVEALGADLGKRHLWEFADPQERRHHDDLAALVADLDRLDVAVTSVSERLDVIDGSRAVEAEALVTEWPEAIASIAASPVYGGFHLEPQVGLVPLGQDPHTGLWAFWHVGSGERPARDAQDPTRWKIGEDSGLVLVLVPAGTYVVGSRDEAALEVSDDYSSWYDKPAHEVSLAPFFIATREVTQAQWLRWTGHNPSSTVGATHPVEMVSYVEMLQVAERLGLTLPTETQWEVACRARSMTPWPSGAEASSMHGHGNMAGPSIDPKIEIDDDFPRDAPVASFLPNDFGLYDMIGNVAEFCRGDYYGDDTSSSADGESLPQAGATHVVAVRGGSWASPARMARSAWRQPLRETDAAVDVGARFARRVRTLHPGPPLRTPRSCGALTMQDGRILIMGGVDAQTGLAIPDIEVYDPRSQTMLPQTLRLNVSRTHALWNNLADGRVLVFGGLAGGGGATSAGAPLDSVEVLDPSRMEFTLLDLHLPQGLYYAASTLLDDGSVLVSGGFNPPESDPCRTVFEIDPRTWTIAPKADLPYPVFGHAQARLPDGRVFILGGGTLSTTPSAGSTARASLYDPRTDAWTEIPTPAAGPRHHAAAFVHPNGKIYVFGGIETNQLPCIGAKRIDIYDPETNAICAARCVVPTALCGVALLPDGAFVLVGGVPRIDADATAASDAVYRFDPRTESIMLLDALAEPRTGAALGVAQDGSVIIAGGGAWATIGFEAPALATTEILPALSAP